MALAAASTAAAAAATPERLITYAARSCPSYEDVSANLARNNIQESLRDLGPNTNYYAGQPISPQLEEPNQPNCTPLVNWHFRLGTGIAGRVRGTWGSLSVVSSPFDTSVVTRTSTPLLNDNGDDTGYTLPGAVTVRLTDAQYRLTTRSAALWVQGGEVDDPVMDRTYPQQYGFAALRCAIDNYNGDNVESINYPQGSRHVFCYAYYVQPPPTSGTIIVRKVVDDPTVTTTQSFTFQGNISYRVDRTFTLGAAYGRPGSETFFRAETRAGDDPWTFGEQVPPGWSLSSLVCTSASGRSVIRTDQATGLTSVTLAASDTVTCTYTDRPVPPTADLIIGKKTIGGVGTFGFAATGPETAAQRITTVTPGVVVTGAPLTGTPGTYTITEALPPRSPAGRWVRSGAQCGGQRFPRSSTVRVTLTAGTGAACVFTNTFIPAGRLTVRKAVLGATGTARFQISAVRRPAIYTQVARVGEEGVPVTATGDDTSHLPLGSYDITETDAAPRNGGHWVLVAALCDGEPIGAAQGRVRVRLTASRPAVSCTFVDQWVRGPEPPNPNPPDDVPDTPNAPGTDPPEAAIEAASGPDADLVVTKRVSPTSAVPGQPVTYTVTVRNRGPAIAYDVTVAELSAPGTPRLTLHATRGTCIGARPARCSLGTLAVGARVTITGTVAASRRGLAVNRVGVVSTTNDPNLINNRAAAALAVRSPAAPSPGNPPSVTG